MLQAIRLPIRPILNRTTQSVLRGQYIPRRTLQTGPNSAGSQGRSWKKPLLSVGAGAVLAAAGFSIFAIDDGQADNKPSSNLNLPLSANAESSSIASASPSRLSQTPFPTLLRTYMIYTLSSVPILVEYSPQILSFLTSPSLGPILPLTEWIVRKTFFDQFVGGEGVKECEGVMSVLRDSGVGTMLVYSVEVEHGDHENDHTNSHEPTQKVIDATQSRIEETIRCIRSAGQFERSVHGNGGTWVALKLTGLTPDPTVLHRASTSLLRRRPAMLPGQEKEGHVHYPSTPTDLDYKVLSLTAGNSGEVQDLDVIKAPSGDGGVLQGEEGLRQGDMKTLKELWQVMRRVGAVAREEGVKIAIDAEHSWYQPAIDGYTMILSQEFNKLPSSSALHSEDDVVAGRSLPVFYGTYQAYLRRLPNHLAHSLKHARENGYVLGVKLVRGAYHEQEREKWATEGRGQFGKDPIWDDKASTDKAYDDALKLLMNRLAMDLTAKPDGVPSVGAYFGTHNKESCELVKQRLLAEGLGEMTPQGKVKLKDGVEGRVCTGQLYGMSDDLTETVAMSYETRGAPMASKYLPYGALREVLPYLGRRAIENKSLLSGEEGAKGERRRVWAEIRRRIHFL